MVTSCFLPVCRNSLFFLLWAALLWTVVAAGCRGTIILDDGGEPVSEDAFDGEDRTPADDQAQDAGADATADAGSDGADTSGDAGLDGADPRADTGPADQGPCPTTLATRLTISTISVAPAGINTAAGGYFSRYTPPLLAPQASGAWAAWQGTDGRVHVTPLDAALARAGQDITLEGNELRGLAAHAGGFAVMYQRGTDQMALTGFNASARQLFDVTIIGNNNHDQEGDKYVKREWGDYGRLAFYNNQYAVYFGHTQNWGSQGEHQGDLLWYYELSGARAGGLWDWGCSHSLDTRLAANSVTLGAVCLSDCYPSKGIWFNHRGAEIHPEPSGNCAGLSGAELGGLAPASGGFWLTFISAEGRASKDVALRFVSNQSQVGPLYWLTNSAGVNETNTHLASYGQNLLAAWQADSDLLAAVVDGSGAIILGPEKIAADFNQQTDFVNFPDGDVGWAYGSGSELKIYRLRLCR